MANSTASQVEMEHIQKIIDELQSDDPYIQDQAIKKLVQVANKEAIIALAGCLNHLEWRQAKGFNPDWRGPQGERLQGRVVYEPLSHLAAKALARLVPDPPVSPDEDLLTLEHIDKWQAWWRENQKNYFKGDDT